MDEEKRHPATNVALVKRLGALARAAERHVATPAEAREIIGLPSRSH